MGDESKFETSQDLTGKNEYDDAVCQLEDISDLFKLHHLRGSGIHYRLS
jgi:hypothetical protein